MPGQHIVLVGMMGAGKTTVGRLLARRLLRPYVDTDVLIVDTVGQSVAEIFERSGEPAFRAAETTALEQTLVRTEPVVVAAGGGAVLAVRNQELMRDYATIVWLRASVRTVLSRVGSGEGRPILAGGTRERVLQLVETRGPLYDALAHHVVDVDRVTPMQVTQRIVDDLALEG
jgi:shikimate kinase